MHLVNENPLRCGGQVLKCVPVESADRSSFITIASLILLNLRLPRSATEAKSYVLARQKGSRLRFELAARPSFRGEFQRGEHPREVDPHRSAEPENPVDAGVEIGFGTDSGPPGRFEGYFEHREMELMAEAGFTPAPIIQIASRNSAEILGIDADYGTLEAGEFAEFLVLADNPLDDISNTKALEQVWQRGARIH